MKFNFVKKLLKVLLILQMYDTPSISVDKLILKQTDYLEASCNGFWYPFISCQQFVKRSNLLGEIKDINGDIQK